MSHRLIVGAFALLSVLVAACTDQSMPTAPAALPGTQGTALASPVAEGAGGVTAASHDAASSTREILRLSDGMVVGTSSLVRNDHGVSMTYRSGGVEPGTVATIWWVVFNNPGECAGGMVGGKPFRCVAADLPNPAVDASVFYAAGHVIGESGRANYGAHLPSGRLIVDPAPDANQLIRGDGILKDPRTAEIHLVLRTHGEAIPGLIQHQVHTFDAGCTTAPPALQGPNTCMNLQFAAHD